MPVIKHRTYIKADPERVFETLTTAQGWNAWFTDRTTIDLKTNGTSEILFRWSNFGLNHEEIQDGGEIIEIIPNKSFIFHWSPGEGKTIVKFALQPLREGTLLVVEEKGYTTSAKDVEACIGCAVGWGEALTLLKVYLELGIVYKDDLKI